MTRLSTMGRPLSDQELLGLASIFEITFRSYSETFSPAESDYMQELSTIVGLGFTTALIDGSLLPSYEQNVQTFLQYRDFKNNREHIDVLSRAVANVINETVYLFRFIDQSQYCDSFISSVKKAVCHHAWINNEKSREAEKLMNVLFS